MVSCADIFFVSDYWELIALTHNDHSSLGEVPDTGWCCIGNKAPLLLGTELNFDGTGLGNLWIGYLRFQEP